MTIICLATLCILYQKPKSTQYNSTHNNKHFNINIHTLNVLEQLLHCRHIAPGAGHVQWGVPLAVFGNQSVSYTLSITLKQHLKHLTAGRLCVIGSFYFSDDTTDSWKVTCSNVQWGKVILGADIGVWYRWCVRICACARETYIL